MALVTSLPARRAFLARVVPYLKGLTVRLFANDLDPGPDDPDSAFVEPTFQGYSPRPVPSWTPPYLNPNDYAESDAPTVTWQVTAGGGSDQIFGYWLTDADGHFILAERFAAGPVPMYTTGAKCPVALRFLSGPLC